MTIVLIPILAQIAAKPSVGTLDYNGVDYAKSYLSVAAVLAGFCLTVCVLLLQRRDANPKSWRSDADERSIAFFLGAFFVSLVATFAMAEVSCEPLGEGGVTFVRTFSALLPASASFSAACMMLTLGLAHAAKTYRLGRQMWLVNGIHFLTVALIIAAFVSAIGDLAAKAGTPKAPFETSANWFILFSFVTFLVRWSCRIEVREQVFSASVACICLATVFCGYLVHEWVSGDREFLPDPQHLLHLMWLIDTVLVASVWLLPRRPQPGNTVLLGVWRGSSRCPAQVLASRGNDLRADSTLLSIGVRDASEQTVSCWDDVHEFVSLNQVANVFVKFKDSDGKESEARVAVNEDLCVS